MEKTYQLLKVLVWVLVFAVVIAGAKLLYDRLTQDMSFSDIMLMETTGPAPGETAPPAAAAPDFTVYDAQGQPHKLSDFQGKPVVLNFWASWCGPCKSEMPALQDAYDAYGGEIHFLLVNLTDGYQETVSSAQKYLEDAGHTMPVYFDTDVDAARAYGVSGIPVTYFITPEGNLEAYFQGAMSAEVLQQGIDRITE